MSLIISNAIMSDTEILETNVKNLIKKHGEDLLFHTKRSYMPAGRVSTVECIQILYSELRKAKDLYTILVDADGTLQREISECPLVPGTVFKWEYDSEWEINLKEYVTKTGMEVRLIPFANLKEVDLSDVTEQAVQEITEERIVPEKEGKKTGRLEEHLQSITNLLRCMISISMNNQTLLKKMLSKPIQKSTRKPAKKNRIRKTQGKRRNR